MVSQEPNTTFRTKELSLATVLNLKGHTHQGIEKMDERTAVWCFHSNASLLEIVDEFTANECLVEPREFARELATVRNEMYRYLDQAA